MHADGAGGGDGRSRRWRGLVVRLAVAAALVGGAAIVRPSQVRTTLTSPAALVRIGALVLALVVWSWLVRRLVRQRPARLALVALPLVVVAALVVVPSFRTTRVDEALPVTTA